MSAAAVLLANCANIALDPFGRSYSGNDNYAAGEDMCSALDVDMQPYFVRGNHLAMPIENAFVARNAEATVKFRVEPSGAIRVLKVDSVDKAYANHTVVAVKDWKVKPATRGGIPVAAECSFTFMSIFRSFDDAPPGKANR